MNSNEELKQALGRRRERMAPPVGWEQSVIDSMAARRHRRLMWRWSAAAAVVAVFIVAGAEVNSIDEQELDIFSDEYMAMMPEDSALDVSAQIDGMFAATEAPLKYEPYEPLSL